MNLDIRIPIGLLFGIIGILLTIFGVFSDPAIYEKHSLGYNVNLLWGVVLVVFALVMLALAWRASLAGQKHMVDPPKPDRDHR
jgi:protein-S-isoprenylcysteine O-methyltransferase Ste14